MLQYDTIVWCANYDQHMIEPSLLQEGAKPPDLLGVELSLAKAKGWQRMNAFEWICPTCVTKLLRQEDTNGQNSD